MSEPLAISRKLGIHPGDRVALLHAPPDFSLADLPPGARCTRARRAPESCEVLIAFYRQQARLEAEFHALVPAIGLTGACWVAWPRRAGGGVSDLTDNSVRVVGLAQGLVDVKVAALGEAWSSLRFVVPVARRTALGR